MAVVIRQADLEADRGRLIEGLRQHLNPKTDARRFDWLYAGNPHGPARVWMALDDERGILVGSSALLPRYFYVDGRRRLGCLFVDSWTHPEYRFLGPAVKLQRACVEAARSGEFCVAYDYPRQSMMAVYQRLRAPVADHLVTRTKLLGFDRFLGNRVPSRAFAATLARVLNPVLRFADGPRSAVTGLQVEPGPASCGTEFDDLAERTASSVGLQVARRSDYLNWRFNQHFHICHEFLVARSSGRLVGYLVLADQPEAGQIDIVDLLAEPGSGASEALIEHAVRLGRRRRRSVLSLPWLAGDPRLALPGAGWREGSARVPLVLVWPGPGSGHDSAQAPRTLGFTLGDESD